MEATVNADLRVAVEKFALAGIVPGEVKMTRQVVAMGASTALSLRAVEDSGIVVLALTDGSVVSLPPAADCKGMEVTVVNVGADTVAEVAASPDGTDKIVGSVVGAGADAACVQSSGEAGADFINTGATAEQGDRIVLTSDGVDTWWIGPGVGVWASEVLPT